MDCPASYYDAIGQLTNADSSVAAQDRQSYVYDAAWNLNYRTNNTTVYTFQVDTKNQLTNSNTTGTQTYDANGNVTYSAATWNGYAYSDENQLIDWYYYDGGYNGNGSPTSGGDFRAEFVYDGRGRLRRADRIHHQRLDVERVHRDALPLRRDARRPGTQRQQHAAGELHAGERTWAGAWKPRAGSGVCWRAVMATAAAIGARTTTIMRTATGT